MNKRFLITSTDLMMIQFLAPHVINLSNQGIEIDIACSNVGDRIDDIHKKLDSYVNNIYVVRLVRSPFSLTNFMGYDDLKKIINTGNYNLIWTNEPVMSIITRFAARKKRKHGTKVVYMAHGFHFFKGAPIKNWLFFYPVEKLFSKYADKIITINKEDYLLSCKKFNVDTCYIHGIGVNEERYHIIDNALKMTNRLEMGFDENQKIILCVGELVPNKNQEMAIKTIEKLSKKYPDIVLILAGKGAEEKRLKNLIAEKNMGNNVKMIGYCTFLEKYQSIIDLSISCSKREGLPLNIVETMLSGHPVVATKNRGHCELIEDGINGYIVDIDDVNAMADRIEEIFDDSEKYTQMSQNAVKIAKQYGMSAVKEELTKIFFDI